MNIPASRVFGTPFFEGKLTKKVLFSLPEGTFLSSNCLLAADIPVIAGYVPTGDEQREQYWKKLRALGLPGTLFRAFSRSTEFQVWNRFQTGHPAEPTADQPHGNNVVPLRRDRGELINRE